MEGLNKDVAVALKVVTKSSGGFREKEIVRNYESFKL
jgi:hypothetical protein